MRLWSQPPPNRRVAVARRCLQLALVLSVVGVVPTSLAIWGEHRTIASAAWRDPAENIQAEAIAPDLAILSLAGVPDAEVLALSREMGELETAHSLLVFSADLTDTERTNGWLWLAYRYNEAGQSGRAAQAYRLAGLGAVLSKDLPNLLRAKTLLAVGQQLIPLHDKTSARFFLQQAALIGAHAPLLTSYQRHSLLEQLVPAVVRAGGGRDDWLSLAKTVKSGQGGDGIVGSQVAAGIGWHNPTQESDAALAQARDTRRAVAAAWLAEISASNVRADASSPTDVGEEAWQALRQALLAEEAAVEQYAAQRTEMDGASSAVQETWLRWLLLKRGIAAGGAGKGLVPEWESERAEIDAALTTAWTEWLALQASSIGIGLAGGYQGLDAYAARWAISAAYWGLYPDAAVTDLLPAAQSTGSFGRLRLSILEPGVPPVVGWSE
jgi:hypothetical protein